MLNKLKFDITAEYVSSKAERDMENTRKVLEGFGKLENPTFEIVVPEFSKYEALVIRNIWYFMLLKDVSPSEEVREAAKIALMKMVKFSTEISSRKDLFSIFQKIKGKEYESLSELDRKYIDDIILDSRRNGSNLNEEKLSEFRKTQIEISKKEMKFSENLKNSSFKKLEFTEEEVEGCSSKFIQGLERTDEGKLLIPMQRSIVLETLSFCNNPETRRKVYEFNQSKCEEENTSLLEEGINLRQKMVEVLGDYEDYPDYRLSVRMIGNAKNLSSFIDECKEKMSPFFSKKMDDLRLLKRKETKNDEAELEMQDLFYYERIQKEREHQYDVQEVKKYFPVFETIKRAMCVLGQLFGLIIERVEDPSKDEVWHDDVLYYRVLDSETKEVISMFYLDLFPRPGKFQHFALYHIQQGYSYYEEGVGDNMKRVIPIGAMLSNFNRPLDGSVPLFSITELQTFCHEFGHLLHICCSKVKYARYSGYLTVFDFLEVPSTVIEEFAHEVDFLRSVSSHFEDHSPLPLELCQKIAKSRKSGQVMRSYLRVLRLVKFDLIAHQKHFHGKKTLHELWTENNFEFTKIKQNPDLNGATSFPHIMASLGSITYAVGYYCYLWSKIIAHDLFRKFRENTENYDVYVEGKETGKEKKKYKSILDCVDVGKSMREKILSCGGEKHPDVILEDFLGRKFNMEAFLNSFS